MEQVQQIKQWFSGLTRSEQRGVIIMGIALIMTLFYLTIWEPIHTKHNLSQLKKQSQSEILLWMQNAASEVKNLRLAGGVNHRSNQNTPITLVLEQTLKNAGLNEVVGKIESSSKNGARVILKSAAFNQTIEWLNTLMVHKAILVQSAKIDKTEADGRINASFSFQRP